MYLLNITLKVENSLIFFVYIDFQSFFFPLRSPNLDHTCPDIMVCWLDSMTRVITYFKKDSDSQMPFLPQLQQTWKWSQLCLDSPWVRPSSSCFSPSWFARRSGGTTPDRFLRHRPYPRWFSIHLWKWGSWVLLVFDAFLIPGVSFRIFRLSFDVCFDENVLCVSGARYLMTQIVWSDGVVDGW